MSPTLSPTVKSVLYFVVVAAGAVLAALQQQNPTWTWIGIALMIVGAIGHWLNPSPAQAKKLAEAHEDGKNEGVQLVIRSGSPPPRGFARMPALGGIVAVGAVALACASTIGPIPAPVITDFAQLVSCIVQNMSSISALLLNCGQWTFAEIEAAIAWLTANPKIAAEHPEWLPQLRARHMELVVKMAAQDGGGR